MNIKDDPWGKARNVALEHGEPNNWYPFEAELALNGIIVTGCPVKKFLTRGPRKGSPNWRTADYNRKSKVILRRGRGEE